MKDWVVYCLYLDNFTYIGATVDLPKRILRHNGKIRGGAKYTTSKGPGWKCAVYVSGFKNNVDALQFEWSWKHIKPRGRGIKGRIKQLEKLVNKEHWTQKAVSSKYYELEIKFQDNYPEITSLLIPEYITSILEESKIDNCVEALDNKIQKAISLRKEKLSKMKREGKINSNQHTNEENENNYSETK
jgi:predicted GIY-YIG superfamily endonuclease